MDSRRPGIALLLAGLVLAGCSLIKVRPEAARIPLHFDLAAVKGCTYLGEVVGSEGHWYNSWLLANPDMTTAALNDLRNQALTRGGDTLYSPSFPLVFATSVTILGQAYRCGSQAGQD